MGSIKGINIDSKMNKLDNVSENIVNKTSETIKNNVEEMDFDLFELDTSKAASMAMIGGKKIYGYRDYETEEYVDLKKEKNLDDIDKFVSMKSLDLDNCDLENSSDLKRIPNSVEKISFIFCDIDDYTYLNDLENLERLSIEIADQGINLDQFENKNVTKFVLHGAKGEVEGTLSGMPSLEDVEISYTNLENLDFLKRNPNVKYLNISHNLLSDVSDLYGEDLVSLNIEGNSVNHLDITKFPNLKSLYIAGNYNLYTQKMLDYCKAHDIDIDIEQKDVDEVNELRKIVKELDLDGKTDLEKESIIYSYVIDNMKYRLRKVIGSNEEPIKTALEGKGVCVAYAAFFKALCNVADINAYESFGYGKGLIFGGPHAWNIIEIDGQYYLCDPTWSDQVRDSLLDDRALVYKIKKIWHKIFSDDGLEPDDSYYNVTGKKAEKFMKKHREGTGYMGEGKLRQDHLYQNEKALNIVSIDTSTEEGKKFAIETVWASIVSKLSGIKEFSVELVNKIKDSLSEEE